MSQKRDIATAIILSIVTCGIYGIYWFICLTDDVNRISQKPNAISGGLAFLLMLVTCGIYGFVWAYQMGVQVNESRALRGRSTESNLSIVYLLLTLFGMQIVVYALLQEEVNQLGANG